ncbi:MAG: peroxiredoxin [Pseudomonadota bacterium]
MTISVGDKLPEHSFATPTNDGPGEISTASLADGKTLVLFGVPGAFTPTCNANHLPGYVEHYDTLKEAGADEVAVVSVNDVFVMGAWKDSASGADRIHFLADGSADFAGKIGMELDLTAHGLGKRCKRFSMIVRDAEVVALNEEENPGEVDVTGAATIIEQLRG